MEGEQVGPCLSFGQSEVMFLFGARRGRTGWLLTELWLGLLQDLPGEERCDAQGAGSHS